MNATPATNKNPFAQLISPAAVEHRRQCTQLVNVQHTLDAVKDFSSIDKDMEAALDHLLDLIAHRIAFLRKMEAAAWTATFAGRTQVVAG